MSSKLSQLGRMFSWQNLLAGKQCHGPNLAMRESGFVLDDLHINVIYIYIYMHIHTVMTVYVLQDKTKQNIQNSTWMYVQMLQYICIFFILWIFTASNRKQIQTKRHTNWHLSSGVCPGLWANQKAQIIMSVGGTKSNLALWILWYGTASIPRLFQVRYQVFLGEAEPRIMLTYVDICTTVNNIFIYE